MNCSYRTYTNEREVNIFVNVRPIELTGIVVRNKAKSRWMRTKYFHGTLLREFQDISAQQVFFSAGNTFKINLPFNRSLFRSSEV